MGGPGEAGNPFAERGSRLPPVFVFALRLQKRRDHEVDPEPGDQQAGQLAEAPGGLAEGAAGQQPADPGRGAAGRGDGQAVAQAEERDEHQAGGELLLHGDDRQDGGDEAEGA